MIFFAIAFLLLIARSPRRKTVAALGLGIAAVFYAPYFAWKWSYFHALLPNTFYAKTGPPGLMIENGARYAAGFALRYGYLFAAGALLMRAAGRDLESLSLPLLFTGVAGIVVLLLAATGCRTTGLLLPVLPFVALAASRGDRRGCGARHEGLRPRDRAPAPRAAPGAVGREMFTIETHHGRAFAHLGRRLREILPEETIIGCGSTGAIGYYTDMKIVDILGLTERYIARHRRGRREAARASQNRRRIRDREAARPASPRQHPDSPGNARPGADAPQDSGGGDRGSSRVRGRLRVREHPARLRILSLVLQS